MFGASGRNPRRACASIMSILGFRLGFPESDKLAIRFWRDGEVTQFQVLDGATPLWSSVAT